MEIRFTDQEEAFREELREFLRKELPPDWPPKEEFLGIETAESLRFQKEFALKLGKKGWLGLAWPREYGGQARSFMEQIIYMEEMSYYRAPQSATNNFGVRFVGPTIMIHGGEEHKKKYLPGVFGASSWFRSGIPSD